MARIRTIKPEFWRSPSTAKASPWARLLYIAMWNWADDYGRAEWTPRELLGFAFPHDEESPCNDADFPRLVGEVAEVFGVEFYTHRGRRYFEIPAWAAHQKTEKRSNDRLPKSDHPESAPDQAIPGNLGKSFTTRGDTSRTLGESALGTGERGEHRNEGNESSLVIADATTDDDDETKVLYSATFLDWWKHYPQKKAKGEAFKAWESLRKSKTMPPIEVLISAAKDLAVIEPRPEFRPHPATWIRSRRWEDEPDGGNTLGWDEV